MTKWALPIFILFFALNISVAQEYQKIGYRPRVTTFIPENEQDNKIGLPITNCERPVSPEVSTIIGFAKSGENIAGMNSCSELSGLQFDRYTLKYCQLSVECSKVKLKNHTNGGYYASALISQEFLAHKLENEIGKMEKMDVLRVFAERKFGKSLAGICESPFNYDSSEKLDKDEVCRSSIVDLAFKKNQDTCSLQSPSCYRNNADPEKNYEQFAASFKATPENENVIQTFFKKRNYSTVSDFLASDSEILENLSGIISSTNESLDSKIQSLHTKILDYKKNGKLDPILSSSEESVVFAFFDKLLTDNRSKNLDSASAKKAIENFRMQAAQKILTSSCKETAQLKNICSIGTSIIKEVKVFGVDPKDISKYSSKLDNNDESYNEFKSHLPSLYISKADYKIIMSAERCKAFSIVDKETTFFKKYDDKLHILQPDSLTAIKIQDQSPLYNRYIPAVGSSTYNNSLAIAAEKERRPREIKDISPIKILSPDDISPVAMKPIDTSAFDKIRVAAPEEKIITETKTPKIDSAPVQAAAVTTAQPKAESSIANIAATNIQTPKVDSIAPPVQNDYKSYIESKSAEEVKSAQAQVTVSTGSTITNPLNPKNNSQSAVSREIESPEYKNKVSDLTDKLAASEANLKQLKDDQAENEKATQAQKLRDLDQDVKNLKAEKQKREDANVPISASSGITATSKSKESEIIQPAQAQELSNQVESPTASNAVRAATSGRIANTNQTAEASASRNPASLGATGGSAVEAKSGMTLLLKLDGVSSEKENELITNKILELKDGFTTEKNGVVLQVLPIRDDKDNIVYENGKPLYKIVQPKVAKKVIPKSVIIASPADLAESEKAEVAKIRAAVRAKELRDITNGALSLEKK